jgi:hypothetical protein
MEEDEARCEVCGVVESTDHIITKCRKMGLAADRASGIREMEAVAKGMRAKCKDRLLQEMKTALEGPDGMMMWLAMPTREQMRKLRETGALEGHIGALLRPLTTVVERMFVGDMLEGTHLSQVSKREQEKEVETLKRKLSDWCATTRTGTKAVRTGRRTVVGSTVTGYGALFSGTGRVVMVRGDGNCFFRTIAVTEGQSEDEHGVWRERLVEFYGRHMEEHAAQDSGLAERLGELARNGSWAHEFDVKTMAEVLGKTIEVWVVAEGNIVRTEGHVPTRLRSPGVKTRIIFKNDNHFDALMPLEETGLNDDGGLRNDTFHSGRSATLERVCGGKGDKEKEGEQRRLVSEGDNMGKRSRKALVVQNRAMEHIMHGSYEARYRRMTTAITDMGWEHPWVFDPEGNGFFEAVAVAMGKPCQEKGRIKAEALKYLAMNCDKWSDHFKRKKDLLAYIQARQSGYAVPDRGGYSMGVGYTD